MNDEEKKALDELKEEINKPVEVPEDKFDTFILYNIESAKIILNLIEKQSKEIEELSDKLTEKICKGVEEEILEEYRQTIISKDKEIEELKEDKYGLEEEVQIQEKNLMLYENALYEIQNKIKAKIEEIKKSKENIYFEEHLESILQSLLEKE